MVAAAREGVGHFRMHDFLGRRHSARFFELADQPMEMVMAVTEEEADRLFERIEAMNTKIFYIKTPIEYGQLGKQKNG
jgi:hypothetical protein